MRFPDFGWATYDREFSQQTAATSTPKWLVLDNTRWNLYCQVPYLHQHTWNGTKIWILVLHNRFADMNTSVIAVSGIQKFHKTSYCLTKE